MNIYSTCCVGQFSVKIMAKNVLSGQRLVLFIRGLCNDFSVAKGMRQACVITDLRAPMQNSAVNIISELFYLMNFGFCGAETQTWKFHPIFKRHQRGISRQCISLTQHQQFDLESLLAPCRFSLLTPQEWHAEYMNCITVLYSIG
jgi:hypothetical protein